MYCLYHIGRTAHPIQCTNDCPWRQKYLTWHEINSILKNEYMIPKEVAPTFLENYQQLRQIYNYIGHYQIKCVQWDLLVDEKPHFVVMHNAYNLIDINEAIAQLDQNI